MLLPIYFWTQIVSRHHSAEYHNMLLSSTLAEPGNMWNLEIHGQWLQCCLCCLCFLRWRQYLIFNIVALVSTYLQLTQILSDKWGETSSTRTSSCLNTLITEIFGLICCFVNFYWAVYANAWSVTLVSFIFNCYISSFWNYLYCFTVSVVGEREKSRSYFTEVLGLSSHGSGLLSTSDVSFLSLFAGKYRILCWNSELALIYGWTEVQMCHRLWKIPIWSVFKVGAGFSLCSSASITPFPPSVMVRLPCLSYFHL